MVKRFRAKVRSPPKGKPAQVNCSNDSPSDPRSASSSSSTENSSGDTEKDGENSRASMPKQYAIKVPSMKRIIQTAKKMAVPIRTPPDSPPPTPKVIHVAVKFHVVLKDIAKGRESHPIRLINDVDEEAPPVFKYLKEREIDPSLKEIVDNVLAGDNNFCCNADTCAKECQAGICPCRIYAGVTISYSPASRLMYNELDSYNNADHVLKECNYNCHCHRGKQIKCQNRVYSKGPKVSVDVFRTEDRGWGLRARELIKEGTYIGEYTGLLRIDNPEDGPGGDYLHGVGEELAPEIRTVVDACDKGNYTRFINHSCEPNVFVAKVAYETLNRGLLHLCLFALYDIQPSEELLMDYGQAYWDVKSSAQIYCLCGSRDCRHLPPPRCH